MTMTKTKTKTFTAVFTFKGKEWEKGGMEKIAKEIISGVNGGWIMDTRYGNVSCTNVRKITEVKE